MKALSVRAPWWWFILHGGKDIENRDWRTSYRGRVLLHVGKWWDTEEVCDDWDSAAQIVEFDGTPMPMGRMREFCGCLVGSVEIIDCVERSNSPWFFGEYGFVLSAPISFPNPIKFKGALRFFDVPDHVAGLSGC